MTKSREFNAATVEEAIEKAARTLGVNPDQVSYEVVDPGTAGFLGIGARDARINVEADDFPYGDKEADDLSEVSPESQQEQEVPEEADIPAAVSEADQEEDIASNEPVPKELLDSVEQLVSSTLQAMGFEARTDVYDAGDVIAVDVATKETGLFIGQKGETIDALQYLVNVAIYKNRPFLKRIVLDSEGYRQRRIEAIQGMAHRTARRVVRERRSVELPPMSSSERRVVHLYLKDHPKVNTASQGVGANRRVTVFPA